MPASVLRAGNRKSVRRMQSSRAWDGFLLVGRFLALRFIDSTAAQDGLQILLRSSCCWDCGTAFLGRPKRGRPRKAVLLDRTAKNEAISFFASRSNMPSILTKSA